MLYKDSETHYFKLWMGVVRGVNMRENLLSVCGFLWFFKRIHVFHIQIVGDSKVIIDREKEISSLHSLTLENWSRHVRCLFYEFSFISFEHIYREFNANFDRLSKILIREMGGGLFF